MIDGCLESCRSKFTTNLHKQVSSPFSLHISWECSEQLVTAHAELRVVCPSPLMQGRNSYEKDFTQPSDLGHNCKYYLAENNASWFTENGFYVDQGCSYL